MFKTTLILISFVSLQVFAAPVQVIDTPNPEQVFRDSSAFHRMNKSFSLNYIALGVGPSVSGSIGIDFGFYLDRNSLIDLEYINGRPLYYSFLLNSDYDVKTNSFGIHYKQFMGNSFYFRVGGDYRTVDYSYVARDFFSNAVVTRDAFKGSSLTATFLIGNQWQWENFTLGCDWIGIAVPLTNQLDSESSTGSSPNYAYLHDDEDLYLKKSTSTSLRFYLGASF